MKLCQRCSLHPATTTVSGLPMCGVCTAQLDWRYGAPKSQVAGTAPVKTGAISDVDAWGVAFPALGAYEAIHGPSGSSSSGSDDDSITGSAKSAASAVKETASSIKTVAVVIGLVTGVSVLYLIWQAAKNARAVQHEAFQVFASNPEARQAATHAILL